MTVSNTTKHFPGSFTVYKKLGAAQFTMMYPRHNDNGRIDKNGAILLEVAEGAGDKSYKWSEKISFAFGISDLCNIFDNPDTPPKLVHSSPASPLTKFLEFTPGEGKYAGTYMLKLSEKNNETNTFRNVNVPITSGEYTLMLRLFMTAAPIMIGWA